MYVYTFQNFKRLITDLRLSTSSTNLISNFPPPLQIMHQSVVLCYYFYLTHLAFGSDLDKPKIPLVRFM
jgi:hypothetical protein